MPFPNVNGDSFVILDGALGTMLQKAGMPPGQRPEQFSLEHPDKLSAIHSAYIQAGAQIVCANTFCANAHKLKGSGITVEQAVGAAVACAKKAAGGRAAVALDVGPIGELLEPGGHLRFEDAYDLFAQMIHAGAAAGADCIFIETMTDLYEMRAAVLAAKEATGLPILASMSFETDGRTFSGVPVEAFGAAIGGLGPVALGINCSLGPAEVMPLLRRLCASTYLPVFAKPNAGLPDPATSAYTLSPEAFCKAMRPCADLGVAMVGGCCGTTPETIQLLCEYFKPLRPAPRPAFTKTLVCGSNRVTQMDTPTPIGERMNPTGRKKLQQALQKQDMAYLQMLAVQQEQEGAAVMGLNVGAPGVDEVALLPKAVKAVQAVTGLPLQLDSANPEALAAALRVYNGKPILNSTSGEKAKMEKMLPLCKQYGTALVVLTLDDDGIPEEPEARCAIAQKAWQEAQNHGIQKQNIFIDCLTMTAGADEAAAETTLEAVRLVKSTLGLKTMLGVSNISYGLPNRPLVNRAFLAMALAAGLDAPIINTADREAMGMLAACNLLTMRDAGALQALKQFERGGTALSANAATQSTGKLGLRHAIENGLADEAAELARNILAEHPEAKMDLVNRDLIPALDAVGKAFEAREIFLPQLLGAASAAQRVFAQIKSTMGPKTAEGPTIVVATVQGDIHDIGKNIAKVMLENYGYNVIDLGRDVPPHRVVDAANTSGTKLVGLSALMTTTLPAMRTTIELLRQARPDCRVMVGGAVLTAEYAAEIGADRFVHDAMASVDFAKTVYGR